MFLVLVIAEAGRETEPVTNAPSVAGLTVVVLGQFAVGIGVRIAHPAVKLCDPAQWAPVAGPNTVRSLAGIQGG